MQKNAELELFFAEHTVKDYHHDESGNITFNIDGAQYRLSPVFGGAGAHPDGKRVSIIPASEMRANDIFIYYPDEKYHRESIIWNKLYKAVHDKDPDIAENEYIPYIIYQMVTEYILTNVTTPYWTFLSEIQNAMQENGIQPDGSLSIPHLRKTIHSYTEAMKLSRLWMHLSGNTQRLFECVVEHFIRHAKQEDCMQDMSSLIRFIQQNQTDEFARMIKSYPNMPMQDICEKPLFEHIVHSLKLETTSWIRNDDGIPIDSAIIRERWLSMEIFAAQLGINFDPPISLYMEPAMLTHYYAGQYINAKGAPDINKVKKQISSSYIGKQIRDMKFQENIYGPNDWSLCFTLPYKEQRRFTWYQATVTYKRSSDDDEIQDRVDIRLMPEYITLDRERICFITQEILDNGFHIHAGIKKAAENGPEAVYDSLWTFMGSRQDQEYLDNNVIVVNFNTLRQLCDKARME